MGKPKMIELGRGGAALLLIADTGPEWEHQAAGVVCDHPSANGFLEPIPEDARRELYNRFWGRCPSEFEVRQWLADFRLPYKPDDTGVAMEAWIPLRGMFDDNRAILVWENSD